MNIYDSIATRTNGNIYVGVVGPVRTGKSTFITRFMEELVIPNMEKNMAYERMVDELPQSGSGKQIMTMEPRFVPSEPILVNMAKTKAKIRLVDCVGYLIDGATGHVDENGSPRLVKTPWAKDAISFNEASEIGTSKVITDHSTVGILVTTDGTITDIDRKSYVVAEERTVNELKQLGKPFIIVLNTLTPDSEATIKLKTAMEEKYGVTVLVKDIREMTSVDFIECFEKLLYEFPVQTIKFNVPDWVKGLEDNDEIVNNLLSEIGKISVEKMSDYNKYMEIFGTDGGINKPVLNEINLGVGEMVYDISTTNELFYGTLSKFTNTNICSDRDLMFYMKNASVAKKEYDKLKNALICASETGYGVVAPTLDEMELFDPEVVKRGANNSLKLRAKAPSLHIMRVDVETEVTPAVGGGILSETNEDGTFAGDKTEIWNTTMFGRTLADIAHDGILTKINTFPEEAETKMRKTLTKITNEGKGGIICILL